MSKRRSVRQPSPYQDRRTPLPEWDSEQAVKLWWEAKMRRVNRSEASASNVASSSQSATSTEQFTWTLDDWDTWLA